MRSITKEAAARAISACVYLCQRAGFSAPVLDRLLEAKRAADTERFA